MPLATGTAPSGENFEFYVPKGTPDEDGPVLARDAYFRLRQGIDVTQPPPPPDSTFTGELMRGGESLVSALRTAGGAAFGDDEAAALAGLERSEDIAQRYGQGPSLQNVLDAEGVLPTVGAALGQIPQAVAGQGAQLLSTAALAKLGAIAGAPFGPVGSLAGAGIGGLASLIPQFTGYNIERQAQADIDEGRPVDIELGKAVGTAALQSVPELAGQYFVLGKGLVNKLVQGDVTKLSATELRDSAAKLIRDASLSTAKTVGRGIARGAGVEMPTEIAQQVLERAQAGLDVLSSDAISEYGEAAYLAATVGGTLGPIGALGSRSRARSLRDELSGREAEVAEVGEVAEARNQTEVGNAASELSQQPTLPGVDAEDVAVALASPRPETEPPSRILEDIDIVEGLGIPKASPVVKRILGKDLSDPIQRAEVQQELTKYSKNGAVNPNTKSKVNNFLGSSTFVEAQEENLLSQNSLSLSAYASSS